MVIKFSKHTADKVVGRLKKKLRIRKTVKGTLERPRLCVFKSGKHIYAQVVDDVKGCTLLSASSLGKYTDLNGVDTAKQVGMEVGKLAQSQNIKSVVFDRNGYLYHGRVKSLAEGAREAGLNF